MLRNEEDIIQIIAEDVAMMEVLRAAKSLDLPDWWVCAGFVRSKIWDTLHGFSASTALADVDVVYFDDQHVDEVVEKKLEKELRAILPDVPWSVKNEARMHVKNNLPPYLSSVDAISKFPETATALGVKLDEEDNLVLTAPWGINDVLHLEVRPTPLFIENKELAGIYEERIAKKNWQSIWKKVRVYPI